MDSNSTLTRVLDESLLRERPQLQSLLHIAPLRPSVSSRILSIPSPLEPNASGVREANAIPKSTNASGVLPARTDPANKASGGAGAGAAAPESLSTTAGTTAPRTKKNDPSVDTLLSYELPPKPILPSFVNLRALERFPYSSFDDDSHARKRRRLDVQADSFGEHLQLPIPQAQKEQRPPPFGPFAILNGLNEPPPNAALLPPIEAGSITQLLTKPTRDDSFVEPALLTKSPVADGQGERREGKIEEILDSPVIAKATTDDDPGDLAVGLDEDPIGQKQPRDPTAETAKEAPPEPPKDSNEPLSPKTRGRSRKNVRKWTEEETTALLRGVVKCGIGNWTAILAQPELKFNKRSASNLKDRFRVCCPWAYRAVDPNEATKKLRDSLADALSRAAKTDGPDGNPGKIHLPHPWPAESEQPSPTPAGASSPSNAEETPASSASSPQELDPQRQLKRSSSSRSVPTLSSKSKSTLASLGIPEPHFTMKSRRRSRRPFTTAEDEALLKGYAVHGFQWTLIQQDKRLNLSHRRATDLRDRFRTKFPHAYRDGGSVSGKTLHNSERSDSSASGSTATSGTPDSKSPGTGSGNGNHSRGKDTPTKPDTVDQTIGPVDPALSPPAPPQGFLENATGSSGGVFPFPLDDNPAGGAVDSWGDNTLAPMMWDELG